VSQLSLALQDAQHVSWKIFRKIDARRDAEGGKGWNPLVFTADLLEEVAEASVVVKDLEGIGSSEKPQTKEDLAKKLNDILYRVFVLAEHYGITLEETFLEHVNDLLLKTFT
jgi:NTP pyrophosphatase (non-canonical NTP hydrolase)